LPFALCRPLAAPISSEERLRGNNLPLLAALEDSFAVKNAAFMSIYCISAQIAGPGIGGAFLAES
jgi:hypothetical protein